MTIKEVEQELGIPRATIRFYERKNLLSPNREENSYRDYSQEDVERLKTIVVFRKLGISVADIEDILDGAVSLSAILEKNIAALQEQVEELNGAIRVCKRMQARHEELERLDGQLYWEEIHREEETGSRFLDIASDIIQVEKRIVFRQFNLTNHEGKMMYGKKEALLQAFALCVLCGLIFLAVYAVKGGWRWQNFVRGFFWPAIMICVYTIWELPLHFIAKSYPEKAEKIRKYGRRTGTVLVIVLVIVCLMLLLGL